MASKLYPPQIEGILPAFYKGYDSDGEVTGAELTIPFGLNRAVALKDIYKLQIRLKTVSTNTEIYTGVCKIWDKTNLIAYFTLDKDIVSSINEGQFYKAQLAFIDQDINTKAETIGYWSTVGTIKCVAKPTVSIAGFDEKNINGFIQEFVGEYQQDTTFGDSTEKVEQYEFNIWDINNDLILSSGVCLHNSADDISSSSSTDVFKTNHLIKEGNMYYIQYTVTTLNNLQISSPLYKIMQTESVNIEYPLELHGRNNYEEGYIELYLRGQLIQHTDISTGKTNTQEQIYTGTFLITRGSDKDDYFEWTEIIRFNMDSGYPSQYIFRDFTVEQGITYKYRIQQYNIHKLYSNPIYLTDENLTIDKNGNKVYKEISITADFEDMFLYDGKRQLKVRFNPKVTSFKNNIPEQKIETIGSKYPFIFRNGHVNYKEFPISGLISYNMDDAMLFLNSAELEEAKILEPTYVRVKSGYLELVKNPVKNYKESNHQDMHKVIEDGAQPIIFNIGTQWHSGEELVYDDKNINGEIIGINDRILRKNKDLTAENIMSERYFKLKVLDWLTNGEVKLFRSPTEGNYLVRILNVSMSPNDTLGRMLHTFNGVCYEIDDLTYNNLVHYGIITENVVSLTEAHWGSGVGADFLSNEEPWADRLDQDQVNPQTADTWDGFYTIPLNNDTILGFECSDFAPGDIIEITFVGLDDKQEIVIGNTGAYYYYDDDRTIMGLAIKPANVYNPYIDFSRNINYTYEGIQNRKFDTISNINTKTQIAQQYIGPQANIMEYLLLRNGNNLKDLDSVINEIEQHPNIRLNNDAIKFDVLQVEILHAQAKSLVPVYALGQIYKKATIFNNEEKYYIYVNNKYQFQENLQAFEDGIDYYTINLNYNYALTPFGIGYVNYHPVYLGTNKQLYITNNDVLTHLIEDYPEIYVNSYDIKEINFTLNDTIPTPIDTYSILHVYSPIIEDNKCIGWEPTDFYYDTYSNDWNYSYEPYFSINNDNGELYCTNWDNNTSKMRFGTKGEILNPNVIDETIILNNDSNRIYLNDINTVTYTNLGKINKLEIGNGAIVDITFQLQIVDYSLEEDNTTVKLARDTYLNAKNNYFSSLQNYYNKRLDNNYIELDGKIDNLLQQIENMYRNSAITLGPIPASHDAIDSIEDGTESVETWYNRIIQADGTPYIETETSDGKKSEYQKIIDSINQILNDAVNAVPLKRQLLILQNTLYKDLLFGWQDEQEIEYIKINSYEPNKLYYVLINNEYILATIENEQIYSNGFIPGKDYYIIQPLHHKGLLELAPKHFGTNIEMFNEDNPIPNNWYCYPPNLDDTYHEPILDSQQQINRWWPKDYETNKANQAYYVYWWAPTINSTTSIDDERIAADNSFEIIAEDKKFKDSISTILWRIDPNFSAIEFLESNQEENIVIDGEEIPSGSPYSNDEYINKSYSWKWDKINTDPIYILIPEDEQNLDIPKYRFDNNEYIIDDELGTFYNKAEYQLIHYQNQRKSGQYYNLERYIFDNTYNLNTISNVDKNGNIKDNLDNLQDKNITSLYVMAHTPVTSFDNDLIENNLLNIPQKSIEEDYNIMNKEEAISLLTSLNIQNLNEIENILANFIVIELCTANSPMKLNQVYYVNNNQVYHYINNDKYYIDILVDNKITTKEVQVSRDNKLYYYKDDDTIQYIQEEVIAYKDENGIIYPINLNNNYITDLDIPVSEKIKNNLSQSISYFINNNFWDKKIGSFIEAKDDVLIAHYDLTNLVTDYQINILKVEIAKNHYTNLWYDYNKRIDGYVIQLEKEILNAQQMQEYWTIVQQEAYNSWQKAIQEQEDSENIEKLYNLYITANYKIKDYSYTEETLQTTLNNFITPPSGATSRYMDYISAKNNYDIIESNLIQFNEQYHTLSNSYQEKVNIYNALKDYLYDILLSSNNQKSNNGSPRYYNYLNQIKQNFSNFIEKSSLQGIINANDLINYYTQDSQFNINLGYFTIKDINNQLLINSQNENMDLQNYALELQSYQIAKNNLINHYIAIYEEMNRLKEMYKTRISFAANLKSIIDDYTEKIELEKAKLQGLLNQLKEYLDNKTALNTTLPTELDVNNIKHLLAEYLLTLQEYYINEVERRYNV